MDDWYMFSTDMDSLLLIKIEKNIHGVAELQGRNELVNIKLLNISRLTPAKSTLYRIQTDLQLKKLEPSSSSERWSRRKSTTPPLRIKALLKSSGQKREQTKRRPQYRRIRFIKTLSLDYMCIQLNERCTKQTTNNDKPIELSARGIVYS